MDRGAVPQVYERHTGPGAYLRFMNGVSDRGPVPRFILRERDTTTMRIKEYLLKTVAVLLCVVMAAILVALFFMNHTRKTERANDLKKQIEELAR